MIQKMTLRNYFRVTYNQTALTIPFNLQHTIFANLNLTGKKTQQLPGQTATLDAL